MFLAPSRSDLGESQLITTLLGIPLGEPDGKTPTLCASVVLITDFVGKQLSKMNLISLFKNAWLTKAVCSGRAKRNAM